MNNPFDALGLMLRIRNVVYCICDERMGHPGGGCSFDRLESL